MAKLSILIPSRSEQFLSQTVNDLFAKATGEIEVIVHLDAYWPDPPLRDRPNLHIIHRSRPYGMRPGINACAAVAKGDYLMKCDAHCMFAEGFDEILQADCDEDWVVIPRRYSLDAENWCRKQKNPVDYHYLGYTEKEDGSISLHGREWRQRRKDRADILIDDEMSSQGSCWFMSRRHWDWLGGLQVEGYGDFIQEFQEIGCKTWLGGGQVKVNKKTWYAHLHKGKTYGRGYFVGKGSWDRGLRYSSDFWINNRWEGRVHDFSWLIQKFWPVPSWPEDWEERLYGNDDRSVPIDLELGGSDLGTRKYTHHHLNPDNLPSPVQLTKFSRRNLAKWFKILGYRTGAEIGVAEGRYSKQICDQNPDVSLLCVDIWRKYADNPRSHPQVEHDRNIGITRRILAPFNAKIVQAYSMDAVRDVPMESLDFVYIDAHHGFDWVMQDIIEWGKRVRKGGIISGHDYYHFRGAGVVEAVDAYVLAHGVKEWFLTNEKKEKSWFWVKR